MWSALAGQTASGMGAPSSATSGATGGVTHVGGMSVGPFSAGTGNTQTLLIAGAAVAVVALVLLAKR